MSVPTKINNFGKVNASDCFGVYPRRIMRPCLQSFTAVRFKWSPCLIILRFISILSDAFTLLTEKEEFRKLLQIGVATQ